MSYIANYTNSYDIRGHEIVITAPARFDEKTGKVMADLELDDYAAKLALEKYRKQFDIVSPKDIKNLRHHWDFSQAKLAEVLGWNVATVAIYEAGGLPSVSDNRLLKILISSPKVMQKFIDDSKKEEL
ncbi:transcriptional regulator [Lactobacillus johnsonii]|uniref:Transcriptional regulator n=1 Tax=Lactobacillus johnsonii TaxID=33959 RepID=A0A9X6NYU4_LACJH|nr:transcriptional regulator [Lactobacillus johnsonii]OYS04135.1 transcriptional regulator [Lactobacillus johnsonii]OYS04696.1 transcriptional regulator [Lactobacillus johnsonii]OYS08982.1 transcriptional regulator [Lactobacillus johnsonii]OYS10247.1 transcriptional regulator [Lactobacillus johnsonii]OYS13503.1 transcriptional regulator [Lactobacillus johnsonii]